MAGNPLFRDMQLGPEAPGIDLVPVTPNDSVDLPQTGRAIRCIGTAGTVRFVSLAGVVRNTSISTGETLTVAAQRIHSTGTTATGLEVYI